MKKLLFGVLLPLLLIACSSDDDDPVLVPQVSITSGEITQTTLGFTVTPTNAETCAFVCLEEGMPIPSTEQILASGTKIPATMPTEQKIENLKSGQKYIIVAAVANEDLSAVSEPLHMMTSKIKFDNSSAEVYSYYINVMFKDKADKYDLSLNFNVEIAEIGYLPAGTYPLKANLGDDDINMIETETESTSLVIDGKAHKLTEGQVVTSITEDKKYHFDFNFTLDNGEKFVAEYEGEVENMSIVYPLIISEAKIHSINNAVPGEYYVYMHDADWKYELYVDFFSDPEAGALTPGTYVYSEDKTPGTFGPLSNIQIYQPYTNNSFKDGKIVVTVNGDDYTIELYLVADNGREMEGTYVGKLTE